MPIHSDALSSLASQYVQEMTSIRGRRVRRLLKREFADAEHVLIVQVDSGATAVLGLWATGAALCATDGRGKGASVVKWLHGSTEALETQFDLLKDSLPLLGTTSLPLADLRKQARVHISEVSVPPQARALLTMALQAPSSPTGQARRAPGPRPPLAPATARDLAIDAKAKAVILVEGWSDQAAIDTLARRRGLDLRNEGVLTLPIGGVTNLGAFIQALGASGLALRLAGLCDAAEADYVGRVLERAGMGRDLGRTGLEGMGFFVCDADLEVELIRALGPTAVEAVVEAQGELNSFRRFQEQPTQRERSLDAQLHRFMGTRAGRKIRYGSLLADAIDLAHVPRALELVIAHARYREV